MTQPTPNVVPVGVSVGLAPGASKAVRVDLDFSGGTLQEIDLTMQMMRGAIDVVQGAYVDNTNGGAALIIECQSTGQTQTIAAQGQAWIVLLTSGPARFYATCSGGGTARIHFVNYPVSPDVW